MLIGSLSFYWSIFKLKNDTICDKGYNIKAGTKCYIRWAELNEDTHNINYNIEVYNDTSNSIEAINIVMPVPSNDSECIVEYDNDDDSDDDDKCIERYLLPYFELYKLNDPYILEIKNNVVEAELSNIKWSKFNKVYYLNILSFILALITYIILVIQYLSLDIVLLDPSIDNIKCTMNIISILMCITLLLNTIFKYSNNKHKTHMESVYDKYKNVLQ